MRESHQGRESLKITQKTLKAVWPRRSAKSTVRDWTAMTTFLMRMWKITAVTRRTWMSGGRAARVRRSAPFLVLVGCVYVPVKAGPTTV
jgi:hypothetical protein